MSLTHSQNYFGKIWKLGIKGKSIILMHFEKKNVRQNISTYN